MNSRHVLYGLSLLCINVVAAACEQPALVAIPATASIGDDSAQIVVATQRYVAGIREYVACIQTELAAAGGDAAPDSLRNVLIRRNNAAGAEAEAVVALFSERSGRAYLNVLEGSCSNLEGDGHFAVHRDAVWSNQRGPVQTNRLCSSEFIYPYLFETTLSLSQECALGRFFELTAEQAVRLTESRVGE